MIQSATTLDVSARTGAVCQVTGPYQSTRNAQVVMFVKAGDVFPADTDGASTTWVLLGDD